jgi:MYXO-CTERM domain-containing protein
VVENNVVVTDHWHGITLLGARNSTITNNTVVDLNQERPGPPWISIDDHKNGTAPTGCVVRNNLTTALNNSEQVIEENNITFSMDETAEFFVDFNNSDLHLREAAAAVDTGTTTGAPELDRDLIPRPQGDGVDVGAYEWHDGSVEPRPSDGGVPSLGTLGGTGDSGGCAVQGRSQPGAWLFLLVLAALLRRRR